MNPHRNLIRRLVLPAGISILLLCIVSLPAKARNPIRTSFFNAYPSAVGTRLDNLASIQGHCGVCHYQFTGSGPRNPYGQAVEAAIPGFPNNDAGRQQAMHSIENLDADGDGYSQYVEIMDRVVYTNTPTFPGLTPANVGSVTDVDVNDILAYLVPTTGADTQTPQVTVTSPNGGQSWEGATVHAVTWTATDNVAVTAIDIYYRDFETAAWIPIVKSLTNSGSYSWSVHNTPSSSARVRVVARDGVGNEGQDQSDNLFSILTESGTTVSTTLRDFHQPGSQPFDAGAFQDRASCAGCHGGYDPSIEPDHNFQGSMMAQAARDPIFFACLTIAQQDAASSGDLCLRCHTPIGWLAGRSNPTDGSHLIGIDRDGVTCDVCHRAVDPVYQAGISPPEDEAILQGLAAGDLPGTYSNGQFVMDTQSRRRGPFLDAVAPHPFLYSPFHRTSEWCGTCHDVSNPVFNRIAGDDYAPGPLDEKPGTVASSVLLPLERTYSEWLNSSFPGGIYAPEFAGNKPDGIVAICQDCHMRDVSGKGCNDPLAPVRPDLPLHDMTGGNYWMGPLVNQLYPGETNLTALTDAAARAVSMLEKAATVDLAAVEEPGSFRAIATITNRSGHKLPTGYPEGRRMWLHIVARDELGQQVYESGAYDPATGILSHDTEAAIYEAKMGISPALATGIGLQAGASFHFALNDSIYKDNRIPPLGFTNAAFAAFGGNPVDPDHEGPAPRYADGQNWDAPDYVLPPAARTVIATLYYQTTSKEYVEFLRDENTTDANGQIMYDLWTSNGRAAPVAMAADTLLLEVSDAPETVASVTETVVAPNPSTGRVEIKLSVPFPQRIEVEIFDLEGRLLRRIDGGMMSGQRSLIWDGTGGDGAPVGSGIYWMRVSSADDTVIHRVVLLR